MEETDKYFSAADAGTRPELGPGCRGERGRGTGSGKLRGGHGKYRFARIYHGTGNGCVEFHCSIIHFSTLENVFIPLAFQVRPVF